MAKKQGGSMRTTPTPQEIGKARTKLLKYIESQPSTIHKTVRKINREYHSLPTSIKQCLDKVQQKQGKGFLNNRTVYMWFDNRKKRGHDMPLVRKPDHRVKPWHAQAYLLKERNPRLKTPALHSMLIEKHPDVTVRLLRNFYNFMRDEDLL